MNKVTEKIREIAGQLLESKQVDLVIGFENGSLPLRTTPCFVRTQDEVDRLVFNGSCDNVLAKYLIKRPGKIAVVAKGCDSRALVALMRENQISREQITVIGVPCPGMIDRRKVEKFLAGRELTGASCENGMLRLQGPGFEEKVALAALKHETCISCRYPNPVIYDVLAGDPVQAADDDKYAAVRELEALSAKEREEYFAAQMQKCIRCYACRNACPMCYCTECFADATQPSWISKATDPADTLLFHAGRAYHLAGRCVECGACDRACPMGVDQFILFRKMNKDVEDMYHFEAGVNVGAEPALATFSPDDPQTFLVGE